MDVTRLLQVLEICLPVFAMIGIGRLLGWSGILTEGHRGAFNWILYHLALPALVFGEIVHQRFTDFFRAELLLALVGLPLAAILLTAAVYVVFARLLGYTGAFAAAFVFGTFWANVTYLGFPLSRSAFGPEGLADAAVYNAFIMPAFIALGFLLIGAFGSSAGGSWGRKVRMALLNPVILAAFFGILVAALAECLREGPDGALALPEGVVAGLRILERLLGLLGEMGLPVALLVIGAALQVRAIKTNLVALALTVTGKLVLMPLVLFLLLEMAFEGSGGTVRGVAVLLAAMPNAVASYVVARQIGAEEGFVAAMLVTSTLLSILTLPVWLYVIL
jgi:hypothetical protein